MMEAQIYNVRRHRTQVLWIQMQICRFREFTCDSEDSGGIAQRNELVLSSAVVNDDLHVVGAQGDVVCTDGE